MTNNKNMMESIAPKKKRPLWLWILLFIAAVFLSFIGYRLTMSGFEVGNYLGHPGMTIVAVVVVLGLYALFVRLFEGHWARDLSLKKLIPHTLLGLLVGFIFMVLVVSTITALGYATVDWKGFYGEKQFTVCMMFLAVAVGEEMICRGVIFRWIDERWNTWAAMLVSALLFGWGHIGNEGATWWSSLAISIEAGLLLAAAYKWSGTLWVPIGIHWAWNYVQGNVFGLAVSGTDAGNSILTTTVNGPDIITGGIFGPEASIISVILGTLYTLVFLGNRYRRSNNKNV